MKGVFRAFHQEFDNPVQSCRALDKSQIFTRRWLTDNFHSPCTTSFSITQRANSCSNGRQWKQLQQWEAMEIFCYHIALPEGTWILSGVLAVQLPNKDIDNIPARTCTNTPH
jgi:hypothetical protein